MHTNAHHDEADGNGRDAAHEPDGSRGAHQPRSASTRAQEAKHLCPVLREDKLTGTSRGSAPTVSRRAVHPRRRAACPDAPRTVCSVRGGYQPAAAVYRRTMHDTVPRVLAPLHRPGEAAPAGAEPAQREAGGAPG